MAKLSSVRIITAASFETSVPVMPIATPMLAAFSAGASFTPSPVIATMLPCLLEHPDQPDLVLGRDSSDDADLGLAAPSSSSSLIAENSAPVMARPSIPSSAAIAAAVVAWSPVIIRTRMPALLHSAIAAFASDRGGSTMPTIASSVRSFTSPIRSPCGSNVGRVEVALGDDHHPLARLRPCGRSRRVASGRFSSVIGTSSPSGSR